MSSNRSHTALQPEARVLLQYESLRCKALSRQEAICNRSLGLALLIRQGMLAWIEVCRRCIPSGPAMDNRRTRAELSYENSPEMIKVMANIALYNLEEAVL